MSVLIGTVTSRITFVASQFTPIRIAIEEDTNENSKGNPFGQNVYNKSAAKATINLEFDADSESTVSAITGHMNDRKYDKKFYSNEPYSSTKQQDFAARTYAEKIRFKSAATIAKDLQPTSAVEFITSEYTSVGTINTTYWSSTGSDVYKTLYFTFDLTDYLALYDIDTIDRLTLFLHNPYCIQSSYLPGYYPQSGYEIFALDTIKKQWDSIGKQTMSISDTDLRAIGKMNQQFYSIRKVPQFSAIENFVDISGGYTSVSLEVVVNSAVGGETTATLDHFPVQPATYTIFNLFTPMVEGTGAGQYQLNKYTGVITFNTPLSAGQHIKATYTYGFGINTVTFAMQNMTADAGVEMGLNYVGLAVNGYGVKQLNTDNETYRSPYTGSGWTKTLTLGEA